MALVRQIPCKNCVLSVLSTLDSVRPGRNIWHQPSGRLWQPASHTCGTSWACWAFSGVMSSRAWFVHTARNRMSSQTSSPPLSQWIGKMGNPFKQGCSYSLIYIIYIYIFILFKHIQTKRENPMLTPREFLSLKGFKNPFERPSSASWNWDAKSPWQIVPTFSAWQDPV